MKKISLSGRRSFGNEDETKNGWSFQITIELVPRFVDVRSSIFPFVKQWSCIKRAKEELQKHDSKSSLVAKSIPGLNMGILYGIHHEDKQVTRYISTSELGAWQISDKEVAKYGKENLIKKIGEIEKCQPLFQETQAGVYYCDQLKELTASILAVPDVFNMIPFKPNSAVVVNPTSSIILVSHCHDPRGLCLIGELSLKLLRKDKHLSARPLRPMRITKGSIILYEPSIVRNESMIPVTEEQLRNCRKTVFKKSRKTSQSS